MNDIEIIESVLLSYSKRVIFSPRKIVCANISETNIPLLHNIFPGAKVEFETDNFDELSDESVNLLIGNLSHKKININDLFHEAVRFLDKNGIFIFAGDDTKQALRVLNGLRLLKYTFLPVTASGMAFKVYFVSTFAEPFLLKKLLKFTGDEEGGENLVEPASADVQELVEKEHVEPIEEADELEEAEETVEGEKHEEKLEHEVVESEEQEKPEKSEAHEAAEEFEKDGETEQPENIEEKVELDESEVKENPEAPEAPEAPEEPVEPVELTEREEHEGAEEPDEYEKSDEHDEQEEKEEHYEPVECGEREQRVEVEKHEEPEEPEEPKERNEQEELEGYQGQEKHLENGEQEAQAEHNDNSQYSEHIELSEHAAQHLETHEQKDHESRENIDQPEHLHEIEMHEKKVKETLSYLEIEKALSHPDTHPTVYKKIISTNANILTDHAQTIKEHIDNTSKILEATYLNPELKSIKLQENAIKGQEFLAKYKAALDQHQKILRKFMEAQIIALENKDNDSYHKLIKKNQQLIAEHTANLERRDEDMYSLRPK
jgi:hypothetical protein